MRQMPPFDIGDHVSIKPLDGIRARVITLELAIDGWAVVCRYFENGDAKTAKCFEDELVKVEAA